VKRHLLSRLSLFLMVACLAACQPTAQIQPSAAQAGTMPPTYTLTTSPTHSPTLTPNPTLTATATVEQSPAPTILSVSNNGNGTLRFIFPTQVARPISAWRPPLYDVPWALTPYDHFFFTRPIAADEVNWPEASYRYGSPFPGMDDIYHSGIDIEAPTGTPVIAAAPGKIIWAGEGLMYGSGIPNDPYGLAVAIMHDFGYNGKHIETVYAHMSKIDVVVGQRVDTGDQIGLVGQTGMTTGPHLHFEVRIEDTDFYLTRNPELWLAPPQGWGVLAGRVKDTMGNLIHNLEVIVKSAQTGQVWKVNTYATKEKVQSDDYYRENLVLSDLPAGTYTISILYYGSTYKQDIEVNPGMVSYFTFQGIRKYTAGLPPTPAPDFALTPSNIP
jgi:murein DD-endopeptidase MepM/ murein hydrolase activator NlpD